MKAPNVAHSRIIACCLLLFGARPARANGATYPGSGSDVYPIENLQVSMRRELIRLTPLGVDAGWNTEAVGFDCTFWFVNHGDSTAVPMGFPLTADSSGWDAVIDSSSLRFQVEVDDIPTRFRSADGGNVLLWPVHFRAGQERTVRVRYQLMWSDEDMALYPRLITYVLTTGALWRDPIGRSDLVFECGPRMPQVALSLSLPPTRRDRAGVWWESRNIRPRDNLTIRFSSQLAQGFDGRFAEPRRLPDGRESRELLELIDGEWEEGLESVASEPADTLDPGGGELILADRASTLAGRAAIADSAGESCERLALREKSGPGPSPFERLNYDYSLAVERACRPERPLPELLARVREIHKRFW